MKNFVLLLGLLAPANCTTMVAHSSRDKLLGMQAPDLVTCAGKPDSVMQVRKNVLVAEWSAKESNSKTNGWSVTLPLGASVTLSPPQQSCHMQAAILRDGTVVSVGLSSTTGIYDDDGSCAQLVAECVFHPDSTGKDNDYDAFEYFLPSAPASTGAKK